jgi:hypothetical protein
LDQKPDQRPIRTVARDVLDRPHSGEALRESRGQNRMLARFVHVAASGFAGG